MNSKEVLTEIRSLLFGEEEKKEVEMATATLVDGAIVEWKVSWLLELKSLCKQGKA